MKYLIVSHDAGAAEVVSAWAKKHRTEYDFEYYLDGPAVDIFNHKLGQIDNLSEVDLNNFDTVVIGSGVTTNFERIIVKRANEVHVKSIIVLDHWDRYYDRFPFPWQENLPTEIWVTDQYAYKLAIDLGFPKDRLSLQDNYYFKEIENQINLYSSKKNLLYISEYGDVDMWNSWGCTEFQRMRDFIKSLPHLEEYVSDVCVRLHPNESIDKYNKEIFSYNGVVNLFLSKSNLMSNCAWADVIVGAESMAMVVGLLAGKKVFSCLPSEKCKLPYGSIIHIESFKDIRQFLE